MGKIYRVPKSVFEKNIDVLVNEYNSLKEELMQFHRMQQQLSVQTPIVVGALFWVMSWEIANELAFYALIFVIPIYCYATMLSSVGLIIRCRNLRQYLMGLEIKINDSFTALSPNLKRVSYIKYYINSTSGKKGILYRLDTGPPVVAFLLIPLLSFYICWNNYHSYKSFNDVLPFIVINVIAVIIVWIYTVRANGLIRELKEPYIDG